MPRFTFFKCRIFNQICYRIRSANYTFFFYFLDYFFRFLDYFFRKVLGRFLVFFVYSILTFFIFTAITIVLPFEAEHRHFLVIIFLVFFAFYLFLNIIYHYRKASTIHPGNPPKLLCEPICRYCHNYKPFGTHHCVICNSCILKMDHHCIWINQCVGAKNHRHFFQFLIFIVIGSGTFIIAAFNTFYYNYWHPYTNNEFCGNSQFTFLPWYFLFCIDDSMKFINSTIFFTYFLCIIIFFLVGSLFYWNFVLISSGYTYIGLLKKQAGIREILQILINPFKNPNFYRNWIRFLGLRNGNGRTFVRHIIFPSSHESFIYEEDMPTPEDFNDVLIINNRNSSNNNQ